MGREYSAGRKSITTTDQLTSAKRICFRAVSVQQERGDEAASEVDPCAVQWGCSLVQHLLAMIGQMLIGIRVVGQPRPGPVALLAEVFDNPAMGLTQVIRAVQIQPLDLRHEVELEPDG